MPATIEYQSIPANRSKYDWYGRLSVCNAAVLVIWLAWGSLRLVDAFYSGPGNAPFGPAHRPWWYVVYGGGATLSLLGLVLGIIGTRSTRGDRALSLIGVLINSLALVVFVPAIPYQG